MNISHQTEYEAIPGFFVDFYIKDLNGRQVIIEFDGPNHYRKDDPTKVSNKSKAKKDILKSKFFFFESKIVFNIII